MKTNNSQLVRAAIVLAAVIGAPCYAQQPQPFSLHLAPAVGRERLWLCPKASLCCDRALSG
jgi:hypothetical protein